MVETIPVVILAGGEGRRIGGGKPERQLADMSLIERAIIKASSYSSTVAISVGRETHLSPGDCAIIQDEGDAQGPIAGLAAALKFASAAGADHVLIMPCDTPFLPEDLIRCFRETIGDANAAVARCAGQLHAACSLWRVDAASMLPEYLAQGRRSIIGFAETTGYVPVEWPESDSDRFMNINTAGDLLRAEQIFARLS